MFALRARILGIVAALALAGAVLLPAAQADLAGSGNSIRAYRAGVPPTAGRLVSPFGRGEGGGLSAYAPPSRFSTWPPASGSATWPPSVSIAPPMTRTMPPERVARPFGFGGRGPASSDPLGSSSLPRGRDLTILPPYHGPTVARQAGPIPLGPPPSVSELPGFRPRTQAQAPGLPEEHGTLTIRPSRPMAEGPRANAQGAPSFRPQSPPALRSPMNERMNGGVRPPTAVSPLQPSRLRDFLVPRQSVAQPLPGRIAPSLESLAPDVSGATAIDRFRQHELAQPFRQFEGMFGDPAHQFAFIPRRERFRDFDADDFFFFRDRDRTTFVVLDFFYPFYFTDPYFVGFGVGYFPSIYNYWGWTPGWIAPDRCYYSPYDTFLYGAYGYGYSYGGRGYALDYDGVAGALDDIDAAWLSGSIDRLAAHLSDGTDVRVYFDGQYRYTTNANDYYGMTLDTLSTTHTVSLRFDDPIWISPSEVFITGRQVFDDPDGAHHTLYVSYRLQDLGNDWYIVGFGSSQHPIESDYHDFRY